MEDEKREVLEELANDRSTVGMICVTVMFVSLMAALAFGKS